jgi:hypothetical protein
LFYSWWWRLVCWKCQSKWQAWLNYRWKNDNQSMAEYCLNA